MLEWRQVFELLREQAAYHFEKKRQKWWNCVASKSDRAETTRH